MNERVNKEEVGLGFGLVGQDYVRLVVVKLNWLWSIWLVRVEVQLGSVGLGWVRFDWVGLG